MGFSEQTGHLLDRAESLCAHRGARLTGAAAARARPRAHSSKPAGAYDLLDRLRAHHKGAAPPTVYRALDFLLEQGLIHKVERLSAFVGCVHSDDHDHDPMPTATTTPCSS